MIQKCIQNSFKADKLKQQTCLMYELHGHSNDKGNESRKKLILLTQIQSLLLKSSNTAYFRVLTKKFKQLSNLF